ncbi:MAG: cell division protein FtsA [Pseudomonadota bacterium]
MASRIFSAIDIGTAKIACLIGEQGGDGAMRILGQSLKEAQGIENGQVTDAKTVSRIIGSCIRAAEQMAEHPFSDVTVCTGGLKPYSKMVSKRIKLHHGVVNREAQLRLFADPHHTIPDHLMVHNIPGRIMLDDVPVRGQTEGLHGEQITVDLFQMYAQAAPIRNLLAVMSACQIAPRHIVFAGYASGLSVLIEQERQMGSLLLDLGAGLTQACLFYGGGLVKARILPLGGRVMTMDLARGLATPIERAEKLKANHGSVLPDAETDSEMIKTLWLGDEQAAEANQISKGQIASMIRPRFDEILEMLKGSFTASELALAQNIVVTGGAAELDGVLMQVERSFEKPTRLGRPRGFPGLSDADNGPELASSTGTLRFASQDSSPSRIAMQFAGTGWFSGFRQWLSEKFL